MPNVTVMGTPRAMPGLKGSLASFRKAEAERGDALLNIAGVGTIDGNPCDPEDPRPAYQRQEWPRMIYHADGREVIVNTTEEMKAKFDQGFRKEPYMRPQVAVLDPAAEKKLLIDQLAEERALRAKSDELLKQLADRLQSMENDKRVKAS